MNSKASDVSEGVGRDALRWATLQAFNDRDDKAVSDVELAASILNAAGVKLSHIAEASRKAAQEKHVATLSPPLPSLEVERLREALDIHLVHHRERKEVSRIGSPECEYHNGAIGAYGVVLSKLAALSALPLDGGLSSD